jgi:lactate dehydrogenase-like 2-hydroxyacid dehydrogenase
MRIVISEFIDDAAVSSLAQDFDVRYDAALVERPAELGAELASADALVLAGCPGLLLTPHIAGVTRESNARVSALVVREVAAALARRRDDTAHA